MNIGEAVSALKEGFRVTRPGWNGKGMFIQIMRHEHEWNGYDCLEYVAMKTADNFWIPWLCSQTDLLADDWEALE